VTARLPLHALTLHRPWPMVMSTKRSPADRFAIKPIENRGWPPPESLFGHYFALHAGKTWDQDGADFIKRLWPEMPGSAADHPLGITSVGRLIGVLTRGGDGIDLGDGTHAGIVLANGIDAGSVLARLDLRWFFGDFGWIVDNVTAIDPVPCRGMQGLWKVPDAELALVRERWKAARHA
jgi:hypothetical protein